MSSYFHKVCDPVLDGFCGCAWFPRALTNDFSARKFQPHFRAVLGLDFGSFSGPKMGQKRLPKRLLQRTRSGKQKITKSTYLLAFFAIFEVQLGSKKV